MRQIIFHHPKGGAGIVGGDTDNLTFMWLYTINDNKNNFYFTVSQFPITDFNDVQWAYNNVDPLQEVETNNMSIGEMAEVEPSKVIYVDESGIVVNPEIKENFIYQNADSI